MPTADKTTTEPTATFMASLARGDRESIAHRLHLAPVQVQEMANGLKRNPFEASAVATEAMRDNGNPSADMPFLALSRRLSFVSYRIDVLGRGEKFASVLTETAGVVNARAASEADGVTTPAEHMDNSRRAFELSEVAWAYGEEEMRLAKGERIGPKPSPKREQSRRATA